MSMARVKRKIILGIAIAAAAVALGWFFTYWGSDICCIQPPRGDVTTGNE